MRLVRWWVWVGAGLLLTLVVVNCKGDDTDKDELLRRWEQLPRSQEELPRSQEELPRRQEELPRSQEELSRSQEELPMNHEELFRSQEELPRSRGDDVMDEVTASPPVTPPSPRQTGEEILLSLCPPKGSTPLQVPRTRRNLLVVSTLDGQLTALDLARSGEMVWSTATHPGPMLQSTISSMELDDRGQWMKLIPSLTGKLYKFNGEYVEPLNVDANSFVSYSLKMQKTLIFTGGRETRTMGIDLETGILQYECSMEQCSKFSSEAEDQLKDILVVQRNTQTVKAHEPRTGAEKWNFSVSLHDIDYHPGQDLCEDVEVEEGGELEEEEEDDFNIKTVVPEGVICAVDRGNQEQIKWRRKFQSPIVDAWRIRGGGIEQVDLFSRNSVPRRDSLLDDDDLPDDDLPPHLYIGRHENQLYIQESILLHQQAEQGLREYNLNPTGSEAAFPRVSWKPYLVSPSRTPYYAHGSGYPSQGLPLLTFDQVMTEVDAKSTALAINRDDADYPYDSGYFLYPDRVTLNNDSNIVEDREREEEEEAEGVVSVQFIYMNLWHWWKEVVFISMVTAFMMNYLIYRPMAELSYQERSRELVRYFQDRDQHQVQEKIVVVEVPVQVHHHHQVPVQVHLANNTGPVPQTPSTEGSDKSYGFGTMTRSNSEFSSRYLSDFEPKECLGRGGFGVVFESKNKYDDIHYAVKRIRLPGGEERRKKVKREVRVLAKLEHKNIVRYFSSWEESPPLGWQEEQDSWFADADLGSAAASPMATRDFTSADFSMDFTRPSPPPPPRPPQRNPLKPFTGFSSSDLNSKYGEGDSFSVVFQETSSTGDPDDSDDNDDESSSDPGDTSGGVVFEESGQGEAVILSLDSTSEPAGSGNCQEAIEWAEGLVGPAEARAEGLEGTGETREGLKARSYLYIVMQLCHKQTLRDWLRDNPLRQRQELLGIFRQICVGVDYVHSMGLVHRDLKPSNIYFSTDAERVIKIGDFGLVTNSDLGGAGGEAVGEGRGDGQLTDQVGTHMYMSPEQLGQRPYNHKVDIYSLGLIFLELLVSTSTAMERLSVLSEAKQARFPPSLASSPEEGLLASMLHHSPERRPEAQQVLEVGWLQEVERRKRRLTTSGSSEGVVQYREDILCEEILDN